MHRLLSILRALSRFCCGGQAGFSLLEMSIVLIIIGTLSSVMVPLLLKHTSAANRTLTRQHQEAVFYSLAAHLLAGNPLPCPADPAALGAQFGLAREGGCRGPSTAVGIVPFRTLGMPEAMVRDGYHRFFTYAVEPKVTVEPDDFNGGRFDDRFRESYCNIPGHRNPCALNLVVKNAQGDPVIGGEEGSMAFDAENQDFIAVVIVSHGEAGHGAFRCNGTPERLKIQDFGEGEAQNAKDDLVFIDRPYSSNPENFFRHLVSWVTHKNLVAVYGHTPCKVRPQLRADRTPSPELSADLSWDDEGSDIDGGP